MAVAISGNTYPVKDQLRALGGRWDADRKAWMVPEAAAAKAQALVAGTPKPAARSGRSNYGGSGYRPVRGCSACRNIGRMCKQCQFDEYDN